MVSDASELAADLLEEFWWVLLCIGVLALLVWASMMNDAEWDGFKAKHHCIVVGKETGGVGTTPAGPVLEPDKTTYRCDDGVEYTR
jgi:hypothetical protein